jgi:nicotinamidase-related amidase
VPEREDILTEHGKPFVLVPSRCALIVIDMQYASASRKWGLGALLDHEGRADEGEYRFSRIEQVVLPNIIALLRYFRVNGLARIFVKLACQLHDGSDFSSSLRDLEIAIGNLPGSRESEILDEIRPTDDEVVIVKTSFSAFTSTGIDSILRNLGVDTLLLCGVSTSQCVDLTARDAADRGYRCVMVEDAVAEDTSEFHTSTLDQFRRLFGHVETTADTIEGLAAEDTR